jgi:hypothetical protein
MYSYIIKPNYQQIPILIKRKDGVILDYTDRIPPDTLRLLYTKAILHDIKLYFNLLCF